MAPELVLEQDYDTHVDIWSLGITAIGTSLSSHTGSALIVVVEMAERKPPYFDYLPMRALFIIATPDRPSPTLAKPEKYSAEFTDFIAKCLVKDPRGRPSATELLTVRYLYLGGIHCSSRRSIRLSRRANHWALLC